MLVVLGGVYFFNRGGETGRETIKIGAALGLSGDCAEWGEGERDAILLAAEEVNAAGGINGKQIEVVVEDTQCDNKATVNAVQKLVNIDRVSAVVGPTWGDSFQGGYPILQGAKIVSVSPSAAMESLEYNKTPIDFVFSTWFPQRSEIEALQKYASSVGMKKFVIIHDQDPFGAMMGGLFTSEAAKNGLGIIDEHETVTGSTDFRTILARVKSKETDGIFISLFGPDKVNFIKQAKEFGIKKGIFSSSDIQDETLLKNSGKILDGVIYTYPITSGRYDEFSKKHQEEYNRAPAGQSTANAYDAFRVLIEAMRQGNLVETILHVKIPGTIAQEISFNEKHQISGGSFQVKTIRDGAFVEVK